MPRNLWNASAALIASAADDLDAILADYGLGDECGDDNADREALERFDALAEFDEVA